MFIFIDSIDDLAHLNLELSKKPYLAVDTEFRRTSKYNMRLALLQVNDGEEIYLIDTILIEDPGAHVNFLFSSTVLKILHSCKEDLEAIYSWTNKEMVNIFDTQIAHSLLGGEYTIGYQALVEKELGIILDKNETRSNWIRRPLTDSQLKYATLDVEYLIHLYKIQFSALSKSSKLSWLYQDIKQLSYNIFNVPLTILELKRTISKAEEIQMLNRFNDIVEEISQRENINPTLFFSKKSQKDFLRTLYLQGLTTAYKGITEWRVQLIKEDILNLIK